MVSLDHVLVDVVLVSLAKVAILVFLPEVDGGGRPVVEDLVARITTKFAHA